jgi:hypothetical protein
MMRPHEKGCEYYAEGGQVEAPDAPAKDDPATTLGHAGVHHGLIGLLKNVGRAQLADHDRHIPVLEDAKTQHAERMEPKGEEFKKTLGNRLGHHIADQDHEEMAERLQGHPLVGGVGKGNLAPILKRLAPEMVEKESNPTAFRGAVDYLHSAIKGSSQLDASLGASIGGKKADDLEPDQDSRAKLKEFLDETQENPAKLLEVGGNMGHYLPEHSEALGAMTATAVDYLNSLKPKQAQSNPLDEPMPVDKMAEAKFNRALDIANHPLLTLQHVKNGTLVPGDMNALKTIYPGLYKSMRTQMTERLIEAKAKDEEIPYRQKQAMSLFLGQPLDATQTPGAMQAIIASASPQQAQQQAQKQQQATAATLKQVSQTDALYALPNERRQIDKK